MPISFIPGNNRSIRKLALYNNSKEYDCICFKHKVIKTNNNSDITNNQRVANLLTNNYSGRIQYGNFGSPLVINYLGKLEGQSGGSGRPIRNSF